jgi:hypothetical protein
VAQVFRKVKLRTPSTMFSVTVLLDDREGKEVLRILKKFIKKNQTPSGLIFHSSQDTPLIEANVLHDGLHPTLKALDLPKAVLRQSA